LSEHHPSCKADPALPRRGVDRRAFIRYAITPRCLCSPLQPGAQALWEARIQDVSTGGLRLSAHRVFRRGEILTIELPRRPAGSRAKFFLWVRHATYKGAFSEAGGKFIQKLNADELEALLQMFSGRRSS
jgi:PilZ domain